MSQKNDESLYRAIKRMNEDGLFEFSFLCPFCKGRLKTLAEDDDFDCKHVRCLHCGGLYIIKFTNDFLLECADCFNAVGCLSYPIIDVKKLLLESR